MEGKESKHRKRWITDWWPNRLNLKILRQNCQNSNPYGPEYSYLEEVKELDVDAVIKDLKELMKNSHDWWPCLLYTSDAADE